jgi:hypothetical protein
MFGITLGGRNARMIVSASPGSSPAPHDLKRSRAPHRAVKAGAVAVFVMAAALLGIGSVRTPAAPPSPPFTECPAVSSDTSCAILIVINPDGTLTILQDLTQPPFDKTAGAPGAEDTLIGVVNRSAVTVPSIAVGSASLPVFGFDADALCKFTFTGSGYCTATPKPATGYEGPDTAFSNIAANKRAGTVNFTDAGGGLAAGATTYFSLEDTLTPANFGAGVASALVASSGSATSSDFADPATVSATLTSAGGPIVGANVTFTLDPGSSAAVCHGTTDASGFASCSLTPTMAAGSYPLVASFSGSSVPFIAGIDTTTTFTVLPEQDSLTYTGPTSAVQGQPLTLTSTLATDDPSASTAVVGRAVTMTLGSGTDAQSCVGTTDAQGHASCTIPSVLQHTASVSASARFAGDGSYQAATVAALVDIPTAAPASVPTPSVGAAGGLPVLPAGLLLLAGVGAAGLSRRRRR